MSNKTICIGTRDIASFFKDFRRGFNDLGWNVITVVINNNSSPIIKKDQYDYVLHLDYPVFDKDVKQNIHQSFSKKILEKIHSRIGRNLTASYSKEIFNKIVKQADYFLFLWNSFDYDFNDYEILNKQKKKTAVVFCGDDVRWYYSMKQEFEQSGLKSYSFGNEYDYSVKSLEARLRRIRFAEKYADVIYSRREQAQLQLRPFFHVQAMVYLDDYKVSNEQRLSNPVVVHAPSHRSAKGTQFVLEAFDKLKNEGIEFTPILLENKTHEEAVKIYADADILIDQLFVPGGGKIVAEALACGTIAVGLMAYRVYDQGISYDECPVVDVNEDTLHEKLKELILDYPRRVELAKRGRPYAEKYLDVRNFCRQFAEKFEGNKHPGNYSPTFFRNEFVPESPESVGIYNRYTSFVSHCKWYNETIKPGERNGLLF
ncbi:MAG: hypothetical protein ABI723_23895 [Bacteroidia bacterium]